MLLLIDLYLYMNVFLLNSFNKNFNLNLYQFHIFILIYKLTKNMILMLTNKKIVLLLILLCLFKKVYSPFKTVKKLPFTPNENFKGWFISYFGDENTIYTGNIDEEFKYNLITEEKTDYNSKSVCAKSNIYPLIMLSDGYNKGIPTKIISQANGKP